MHSVSRKAHFNHRPEALWEIIADIQGQVAWREDLRQVERLPDKNGRQMWRETGKRGAAVDVRGRSSLPRLDSSSDASRTRTCRSGVAGTLEIGEYGEVTSLTITEDGEIYNPIFRFMSRFVIGQTATIDGYLRSLGKRLGVEVTRSRRPSIEGEP